MSHIWALLLVKLYALRNLKYVIKKHSKLKITFITILGGGILVGFIQVLLLGFRILSELPFGELIAQQLLGLLFFCIHIMLVFSAIITGYVTLYKTKEVLLLRMHHVDTNVIFFDRFFHTAVLCSWSILLFSLPFVIAYGIGKFSFLDYLLGLVSFVPFAGIACSIGVIICILLVRLIGADLRRWLTATILILVIFSLSIALRFKGFLQEAEQMPQFFYELLRGFSFCMKLYLPNYWLVNILAALSVGNFSSFFLHFSLLWSSFFTSVIICGYCSKMLYSGGLERISEILPAKRRKTHALFDYLTKLLGNSKYAAIFIKDILIFLRDQGQWIQFLLFFGLLVVYLFNLKRLDFGSSDPFWINILLLINLASVGLILVTLNLRFFFPKFSMELKKIWMYLPSSISLSKLFWWQLLSSLFFCIVVGQLLVILATIFIKLPISTSIYFALFALFLSATIAIMIISLSAIYPNPREDNPQKIVSGLGGTLAAMLSLITLMILVGIAAIPLVTKKVFNYYIAICAQTFVSVSICSIMLISAKRKLLRLEL